MALRVQDVKKVGVVGAGTMGSGIAQVIALSVRDIVLLDISDAILERGIKAVEKSLGR